MLMLKPRPYQQKMIDDARDKLAHGKKAVMLVSPAGSGKTLVIAEIARLTTKKHNHILFMAHRKELFEQAKETFKSQDVDLDLVQFLSPIQVCNSLGLNKKHRKNKHPIKIPTPALIITDESHHGLAKSYRKVYEHFSQSPRLGFTATPYRLNGQAFDGVYDDIVQGPTVRWLIDHHYLADFEYKAVVLPHAHREVLQSENRGDYTAESIKEALGDTVLSDVIAKWRQLAGSKKTIAYCPYRDYAQQLNDEFNREGIPSAYVDSHTTKEKREAVMEKFRTGRVQVLCNVDIVSEGFNVPDCSCSLLIRPTKSLSLYIQQAMRCMRYVPGKEATIIDMVGNDLEMQALPDYDFDWPAIFHGKKSKGPGTLQCQFCYSTDYTYKYGKVWTIVQQEPDGSHALDESGNGKNLFKVVKRDRNGKEITHFFKLDHLLSDIKLSEIRGKAVELEKDNRRRLAERTRTIELEREAALQDGELPLAPPMPTAKHFAKLIVCPTCGAYVECDLYIPQDKHNNDNDPKKRKMFEANSKEGQIKEWARFKVSKESDVVKVYKIFEARRADGQTYKNGSLIDPLWSTLNAIAGKRTKVRIDNHMFERLGEYIKIDPANLKKRYKSSKERNDVYKKEYRKKHDWLKLTTNLPDDFY